MRIYKRSEWGARAPQGTYLWHAPNDEGVVHWSASEITDDPVRSAEVPRPPKPGAKWYRLWRDPNSPKAQRRAISKVLRKYNAAMREWKASAIDTSIELDHWILDNEKRIVRSFQDYHMDTHGWNDIGYHFVIFATGNVYECRPVGARGAHCYNANDTTGFCFVMGPGDLPTQHMFDSFHELRKAYGVTRYRGHKQVPGNATACPGPDLIAQLHLPVGY